MRVLPLLAVVGTVKVLREGAGAAAAAAHHQLAGIGEHAVLVVVDVHFPVLGVSRAGEAGREADGLRRAGGHVVLRAVPL